MNPGSLLTTSQAVDPVFYFIFGACLVLLAGITLSMVYFVVRYRRAKAPEPTSQVDGNVWLEILWTGLPTLLVLTMFWYGWKEYLYLRTVPKGALEVIATARSWSWSFTYANGKTSSTLQVPVGIPVKVELQATDVIHGFFIPAFRVKRDMVPKMKGYAWFVADRPGSYDLFCSQYCGSGHSAMITTVEALPKAEFAAWLGQSGEAGAKAGINGKKLAGEKGCLGCHSLDGTPGVGPTFKALFQRSHQVTVQGKLLTITVDDAYLRESITSPKAKIVAGFPPVMPDYPDLRPEEVAALVEFIKGVK